MLELSHYHQHTGQSSKMILNSGNVTMKNLVAHFSGNTSKSFVLHNILQSLFFFTWFVPTSLLVHCSQCLLLLAGDVERNPGPDPIPRGKSQTCTYTMCIYKLRLSSLCFVDLFMSYMYTDAKPKLYDLQCMSYTNDDGVDANFRLMDRIKPRLTDMAIALSFPRHVIDVLKKDSDPVYYLLSEWLEGRNQENDSRPLTWATLITALQHACFPEEVKILEQHFLLAATVSRTSSK